MFKILLLGLIIFVSGNVHAYQSPKIFTYNIHQYLPSRLNKYNVYIKEVCIGVNLYVLTITEDTKTTIFVKTDRSYCHK